MSAQAPWRPLRSPLVWYGGKGQMAQKIIALFPPHEVYLEPFFGGGSILLQKPPCALETVNDIADGVVGFYRVLREPEQFERLRRLADLTPYARVEYEACRSSWRDEPDPVLRAWAWFVMVRQSFGGHAGAEEDQCGWKHSTSWGYRRQNVGSSAGNRWQSAIEGLPAVHRRLRSVQIEHGDWRRVLKTYSAEGVLVYLDPPYVLETRVGGKRYEHEMSLQDHHDLTEALLVNPSMCVLSGYRHEAVHAPLEAAGWERTDLDVPVHVARWRPGLRRVESVWRNPAALAACRQPSLFGEGEQR